MLQVLGLGLDLLRQLAAQVVDFLAGFLAQRIGQYLDDAADLAADAVEVGCRIRHGASP
jgi:hypothetical protein